MNKISRNAPCPCGSGKKYKHCCAILAQNEIIFKERIDTLLNSPLRGLAIIIQSI